MMLNEKKKEKVKDTLKHGMIMSVMSLCVGFVLFLVAMAAVWVDYVPEMIYFALALFFNLIWLCIIAVLAFVFRPFWSYATAKMRKGVVNLNVHHSQLGRIMRGSIEHGTSMESNDIVHDITPRSSIIIGGIPWFLTFGGDMKTIPPIVAAGATTLCNLSSDESAKIKVAVDKGDTTATIKLSNATIRLEDVYEFVDSQKDTGIAAMGYSNEKILDYQKQLKNPMNMAYQTLWFGMIVLGFLIGIYMVWYFFVGDVPVGGSPAASAAQQTGKLVM